MRITHLRLVFLYTILPLTISLLFACKTKEKPVTKDEALAMAKTIETSINRKDADYLNNAIDLDLMIDKMGLSNGGGMLQRESFKAGLREKMQFGTIILQSIGKKGSYQLIRAYAKGDTQHLIFRMFVNSAFNYHDLELAHVKGKCKIADAFIYLTGENLSESMGNVYKTIGGSSASSKDVNAMSEIEDIKQMMRGQDFEGAEKNWQSLPSNIKNMKIVQLLHVSITEHLPDDSAYSKAIERYQALYPNEPKMYLIEIEGYFMQKKYDLALGAINNLDSMLGKDPMLDYERGLVYKTTNDVVKEKACFEQLVKNMPGFEKGHIELIAYYLRSSDYDRASVAIADYKRHPDFDMAFLQAIIDKYPKP